MIILIVSCTSYRVVYIQRDDFSGDCFVRCQSNFLDILGINAMLRGGYHLPLHVLPSQCTCRTPQVHRKNWSKLSRTHHPPTITDSWEFLQRSWIRLLFCTAYRAAAYTTVSPDFVINSIRTRERQAWVGIERNTDSETDADTERGYTSVAHSSRPCSLSLSLPLSLSLATEIKSKSQISCTKH